MRTAGGDSADFRSRQNVLPCKSVVSKLVDVKSELCVIRDSCAELAAAGICSSTSHGRCVCTQAPEKGDYCLPVERAPSSASQHGRSAFSSGKSAFFGLGPQPAADAETVEPARSNIHTDSSLHLSFTQRTSQHRPAINRCSDSGLQTVKNTQSIRETGPV